MYSHILYGDMCRHVFAPLSLVVPRSLDSILLVVRRLTEESYLALLKYTWRRGHHHSRPARGVYMANYPFAGAVWRVLRSYAPRAAAVSGYRLQYEPVYSAPVPLVSCGDIAVYFDPLRFVSGSLHAVYEYAVHTSLPEPIALLLERGCAYFTGSVLGVAASPLSDIDIAMRVDSVCSGYAANAVEELEGDLSISPDRGFAVREAAARGVPDAAQLVPIWQRMVTSSGVYVSVTPVNLSARMSVERRVFIVDVNSYRSATVTVDAFQESAGDYPAVVATREGVSLVVYDGFYTPTLYRGGCFRVKGLRAHIVLEDGEQVDAVAVGVREKPTAIMPC